MFRRVKPPVEPYTVTAVKLLRDWYTRIDDATKRVIHIGPWKSEWAARHVGKLVRRYTAVHRRDTMENA